jgi:hypothetical protein
MSESLGAAPAPGALETALETAPVGVSPFVTEDADSLAGFARRVLEEQGMTGSLVRQVLLLQFGRPACDEAGFDMVKKTTEGAIGIEDLLVTSQVSSLCGFEMEVLRLRPAVLILCGQLHGMLPSLGMLSLHIVCMLQRCRCSRSCSRSRRRRRRRRFG